MNYVLLGFFSAATSYFLVACATKFFERKLPDVVSQSFRYGKLANKKMSKLLITIPKKWFKHFYVVALISYIFTFSMVNSVYLLNYEVPSYVSSFIKSASGTQVSNVSTTQVYMAICLMTFQVIRRFYDTHVVSIFGKDSFFSLHLYFFGLFFYPATALAILCEAPKFVQTSNIPEEHINLGSVKYFEIVAIVVFFWAWWHQHTATVILANLRKNKKGEIVTQKHLLPHGDWFEYLTSPLQAAEILMYTALTIILRCNKTWFFVYLLVVVNQVETMIQSHSWYQKTFKELPKKRKAIVPFIY